LREFKNRMFKRIFEPEKSEEKAGGIRNKGAS
jgi:hypothetical protein